MQVSSFCSRLALTGLLTLLASAVWPCSAHAQQPADDVAQFLAELDAIHAAGQVTPADEQTLATDLNTLIDWVIQPSTASVDQLTADLAQAAAAPHFNLLDDAALLADAQAVLASAGFTTAEIQALAGEVPAILASNGSTAAATEQLRTDVQAVVAKQAGTGHQVVRRQIALQTENVSPDVLADCLGTVELHAVREGGTTTKATLSVEVYGPFGSAVTVHATRRSDGADVVIGQLEFDQVVLTASGVQIESGEATFGGESRRPLPGGFGSPLPAGFDPFDVAAITITTADGTVVQTGPLNGSADVNSHRRVDLDFQTAAGARGALSFTTHTSTAKSEPANQIFLLSARKLPASASVILLADGVAQGTYTTTPSGRLVIAEGNVPTPVRRSGRALPVNSLPGAIDLLDIHALTLTDLAGNVLASVSF